MALLSGNSKSKETTGKNTTSKKSEDRKSRSTGRSICCDNMSFAAKEAYKRLRTNVVFSFPNESKCRVIGLTSAQPSEGKTISSVNLAYSLAEFGQRVLLIDGDLRRSSVHLKLGVHQSPGLSNLLVETSDISSVLHACSYKNDVSFDAITAGDAPPNPSELLGSERIHALFTSLSTVYDFILIDLPPVGAVIDAIAVSKFVDGMIVVVREGHTTHAELTDCIGQMQLAQIKILGFINNGSVEGSSKKYKYRKYGYGYGYRGYGYGYGYGYNAPYYGNYGNYGNYGRYGHYGNENSGNH